VVAIDAQQLDCGQSLCEVGTYRRELDPFLRLLVLIFSGRMLRELGYR